MTERARNKKAIEPRAAVEQSTAPEVALDTLLPLIRLLARQAAQADLLASFADQEEDQDA